MFYFIFINLFLCDLLIFYFYSLVYFYFNLFYFILNFYLFIYFPVISYGGWSVCISEITIKPKSKMSYLAPTFISSTRTKDQNLNVSVTLQWSLLPWWESREYKWYCLIYGSQDELECRFRSRSEITQILLQQKNEIISFFLFSRRIPKYVILSSYNIHFLECAERNNCELTPAYT